MHTLPAFFFQRYLVPLLLALLTASPLLAQPSAYDPSWHQGDQPYATIAVAEDGVYRVSGQDLIHAGIPVDDISPSTLQLFEKGREIPLFLESTGKRLGASDAFFFVGRRNRGTDEVWAYRQSDSSLQSSTHYSLHTDTTHYWLTWGERQGKRYETAPPGPIIPPAVATVRDTLHLEQDREYYYGDAGETGSPLYTRGEGYYWHNLGRSRTYTLNLDKVDLETDALMHLRVRLTSGSASNHQVEMAFRSSTSTTFIPVDTAKWSGYAFQTLRHSLPQSALLPGERIQLRLTLLDNAGDAPNRVLVDWLEASYTRHLEASQGNTLRFTAPSNKRHTFELSGFGSAPAYVFNPTAARRFELMPSEGTATFTDTPGDNAGYWAVTSEGIKAPESIHQERISTWASPSNGADYIILTTEALLSSAQALKRYREQQTGYEVAIVNVQEVFNEFDYGRPTPIAIRRFVHQTQKWATPPRFLVIWGDATYPVSTETNQPDAPWNVPTFGFASSDSWYAMQYRGPRDWSEILAIGRIPIRTNEQGHLFLQKLERHEGAPLGDWQKRMLLLSGGTSGAEQNRLQAFSKDWGRVAASPPTGMDTLYFSKQTDQALDNAFQDSLSASFQRGAVWINYFGHSAAQNWEIVTEEPSDFDNAGRLPFVVSLGCQTGSFAGGRSEIKSVPSYGEDLVVGSAQGAIAHFGTSDLGAITPSARINDALTSRVFRDTMRVMGEAIRAAKAQVAANHASSDLYVDHLLQYNLLGDPAQRLALPTKPDFHLEPAQVRLRPVAPIPSDSLHLTVLVKNRGLVPSDSTALRVARQLPSGVSRSFTHLLPPFPLRKNISTSTPVTEAMIGANRFRIEADPDNVIDEVVESNNTTEVSKVIFSEGLHVVSPRDEGLVNRVRPMLRFALRATPNEEISVLAELSDTPDFSTLVEEARLTTSSLALDWTPSTRLAEGHTYFWRIRIDNGNETQGWRTGSFTVQPEHDGGGWLQQGPLLSSNTRNQLDYQDGAWQFQAYSINVQASSERGYGGLKGQFSVEAQNYEFLGLGFGVLIINGKTGEIRTSASLCTYRTDDQYLNDEQCSYRVDEAQAIAKLDSLVGTLQAGDYLFTRTRHLGRRSSSAIPEHVKELFRTLGEPAGGGLYSQAIDTLDYGDLWIMQARKGHPEKTRECTAERLLAGCTFPDGEPNEIRYETQLTFRHASGTTTTAPIGPARTWEHLSWQMESENTGDELHVGVLTARGDSVLLGNLREENVPHALASISARRHPYLRLRATLADSTERTAPQLSQWQVTYVPTAEVAVDPGRLSLNADTLRESQSITVRLPVVNLGPTPADTVLLHYTLTDSTNQAAAAPSDTLRQLSPGEEAFATATLSARGLAGENVLQVDARQLGWLEYLSFNNTLVHPFDVRSDEQPPRFEVLVDGRVLPPDFAPITDLQDPRLPFVSAQPTITVEVEDEDGVSPLTSPGIVEVYLNCDPTDPTDPGYPCDPATDTTFTPAEALGAPARVTYTPDLSGRDTTHTLRVLVRDAAGNEATAEGQELAYQTHLRVQSEVAVRDLYPYPNPMSTHTTFAFQLEGSDAAQIEDFRIRIYTLTGRLIREFDLLKYPMLLERPLSIGWNKVPWDGRDADGDRVATGVYLYKVFVESREGGVEVNNDNVEKIAVIR